MALRQSHGRGVMRYELAEACRVRQISDCDVKCRITFSFYWKFHVYGPQYGWKTSKTILLK